MVLASPWLVLACCTASRSTDLNPVCSGEAEAQTSGLALGGVSCGLGPDSPKTCFLLKDRNSI